MIRIGCRSFDVVFSKSGGKEHGSSSSGSASDWFGKIWLDLDERPLDGIESDFWHEVVEMINSQYNLGLSHQTITCLGQAVYQVIADNKDFIFNFKAMLRR